MTIVSEINVFGIRAFNVKLIGNVQLKIHPDVSLTFVNNLTIIIYINKKIN